MTLTMRDIPASAVARPFRTAWARGSGSRDVAEALGAGVTVPVGRDWSVTCIRDRVELLVTRRLPNFDLVSVVVPVDVDFDETRSVTAAIGGGPHSDLAAAVAARMAASLGVVASFISVYRDAKEKDVVESRVQSLAAVHGADETILLEASTAGVILDSIDSSTLLVVGAPGGSWLQRQFFGPGHRLAVRAPGGALVVRHAPNRAFHVMGECGLVFGPHMTAGEALRVSSSPSIPVADAGRLIGIVRRQVLADAPVSAEVVDLMEPAVSVDAAEPAEAVAELKAFLDGGPVPVIDSAGNLVGCA